MWLQWAVALAALACFASFVWSIVRFFHAPHGIVPGMRVLTAWFVVSMLTHLVCIAWLFQPGAFGAEVAIGLYVAALVLFWISIWANRANPLSLAFSADEPIHLVDRGVYSLIRHPFYTSYMLAWIAGVIATGQPWLWATVVVMGALYGKAAHFEEEKFSASELSGAYAQYRLRAGMFLPRISRLLPWRHVAARGKGPSPDSAPELQRSAHD